MRAKLPVNTTLAPSSGIGDSTHHAADTSKGDSRTVTVKSLCGESASTKPSARRLPLSTAGSESLDEFSNSVLSDMGILDDDDFGSECGSGPSLPQQREEQHWRHHGGKQQHYIALDHILYHFYQMVSKLYYI